MLIGCSQHDGPRIELLGAAQVTEFSPVGTWSRRESYEWTVLRIEADEDGTLRAELRRETDFAPPFEHSSRLLWSGGGWKLDAPDDFFPSVLHPARFTGEECLVGDEQLARLEHGEAPWAQSDAPWRDELAFRRAGEGLLEERRGAWRPEESRPEAR
jgi:hypothetical protein